MAVFGVQGNIVKLRINPGKDSLVRLEPVDTTKATQYTVNYEVTATKKD